MQPQVLTSVWTCGAPPSFFCNARLHCLLEELEENEMKHGGCLGRLCTLKCGCVSTALIGKVELLPSERTAQASPHSLYSPGELRPQPGSGQFCQSSDKGLEETENLAWELWSHPVPPRGLSGLREFTDCFRLLAGS